MTEELFITSYVPDDDFQLLIYIPCRWRNSQEMLFFAWPLSDSESLVLIPK